MGKKANRRTAKGSWLLIPLILFASSCCLLKPRPEGPYTLYSGRFLFIRGEEKRSGSWEAIETRGTISKIYLYTSMGFPMAVVERKGKGIEVKASKNLNISKEIEKEILTLLDILPSIARKEKATILASDLIIEKRGNIIVIFGRHSVLRIKIERITPRPHHREG